MASRPTPRMTLAPSAGRRIMRAFRHAFLSNGFRLFGLRSSRDYLRFVWHAGRHWGDAGAGVLKMLGYRIDNFNQSHALFLVHEIFADGTYAFTSRAVCPRIVDCGANIGLSVIFFKALHPGANIVAFEPEPVTFARLKETMDRNGLHVRAAGQRCRRRGGKDDDALSRRRRCRQHRQQLGSKLGRPG